LGFGLFHRYAVPLPLKGKVFRCGGTKVKKPQNLGVVLGLSVIGIAGARGVALAAFLLLCA
jgi:hypothetical protein